MHKQFHNRTIEKTYLAIVGNPPPKNEDTLEHNLIFSEKINKSFTKEGEGKAASLRYKLTGNSDRYFLLKVDLLTGRQHQIRAQLADIGCPIRGDVKYGFKRGNKDRSIQLHSFRLYFTHPVSGKRECLEAPCPDLPVWNAFHEIIKDL
jgi:23S rRNA pseudouridine1911/1915/1917 synthase